MLPHKKTKKKKKLNKKKIVICKNSIIPEASPAPNGSIEEKLKSLGKCSNTAAKKKKKKKKFSTSKSLTKVP